MTPITIAAAATGTITNESLERVLFRAKTLLPLEYQSRKVAITIRPIETRKCAPTIQEFRPVNTVIPPKTA
jgi:hypothetical protein